MPLGWLFSGFRSKAKTSEIQKVWDTLHEISDTWIPYVKAEVREREESSVTICSQALLGRVLAARSSIAKLKEYCARYATTREQKDKFSLVAQKVDAAQRAFDPAVRQAQMISGLHRSKHAEIPGMLRELQRLLKAAEGPLNAADNEGYSFVRFYITGKN